MSGCVLGIKMIASSALLSLVVCSLWCLALVEAEHYKLIWKPLDTFPRRTFTKFLVTFKESAGGLQHKTFPASEGDDNGVFEIPESECLEGASIFIINAYYSDEHSIGALGKVLIGNTPNEEGITVIKLFYNFSTASQQDIRPYLVSRCQGLPANMEHPCLGPR